MQNKLKIGNVILDNPFLLAPLAGVTDSAFRRICKDFGASLMYTEMISAKGLCYKDKNTESLLRIYDEEKPIGIQLFSAEPKFLGEAVAMLEDRKNSLIDINMGCPVPKIVKNGEGSAILKNPYLAYELVKAAKANTKKPVTAKIRIGWDREHINAVEVAKNLELAGVDAICVHGRTREDYYSPGAKWDEIAKVKLAVKVPVIGNGDVFCGADAIRMMEETGCDGVLFARGAQGNPWIFKEALALLGGRKFNKPTPREKFDVIMKQFDLACREKSEYVAIRQMRKHISWYVKGLKEASRLKGVINTLTEKEQIVNLLEQYMIKLGDENEEHNFNQYTF